MVDALATGFCQFVWQNGALQFGDFTLKSGRKSPYFLNVGKFCDGESILSLGSFYAQRIADKLQKGLQADMLFGPAYKGIPLVAVTAAMLAQNHQISLPFAYNRKVVKDHGEGGLVVGAQPRGLVIAIDDVITAGTAISQVSDILDTYENCALTAVCIAFDRKEINQAGIDTTWALQQDYGIDIFSIADFHILLEWLGQQHTVDAAQHQLLHEYRRHYGSTI